MFFVAFHSTVLLPDAALDVYDRCGRSVKVIACIEDQDVIAQ
jgi:hypothetical protein